VPSARGRARIHRGLPRRSGQASQAEAKREPGPGGDGSKSSERVGGGPVQSMSVRIRLAASIAMTLVRASDDVKKFWARPSITTRLRPCDRGTRLGVVPRTLRC
jgi:hypothetical protein